MISKLTFEAARDAFAAAQATLDAAKAFEARVETRHAEAKAALQAALDEQALLSGIIAKGGDVKAAKAGEAASAIVQRKEHLSLIAGAKEIAAADVAKAEREFLDARFSHALHAIDQAKLERAGALRDLAAGGKAFGELVDRAAAAGENEIRLEHEARAAAKFPDRIYVNPFDVSKTATHWLCRALPGHIIGAVRESMIDQFDFALEAARIEASITPASK